MAREAGFISRVEVISVAAVVGEVGEPVEADIARLSAEKFAVKDLTGADAGAFPFPRAVAAAEPQLARGVLLDRKAGDGIFKEWQKAPFAGKPDDILGGSQLYHIAHFL